MFQKSMLQWYQAEWVTVSSWIAIKGPWEKDKEWVIWALQPNLYQWACWLTISAKPLIALEIDLSFFKPWCSSFQGKLEPWQGSHTRKTMLACCCPHAVLSWGVTVRTYVRAHTPAHSLKTCAVTMSAGSHRNKPKLVRKQICCRSGLPSHFCSTVVSLTSKEGLCVPSFLQTVVVIVII